MVKRTLMALGMVAAATASVQAEETFMDDRWYIAPVAEYTYTGRSPGILQQAWGAGLGIGKIINEYFNVEVRPLWNHYEGNTTNVGGPENRNADMYGGVVDVQYYFSRDAFQPYAVVAAGGSTWGYNGNNRSTRFLGEAGLGANYELSDNFLLRGDLRYRANVLADNNGPGDQHGLILNIGFMVPFGEKPHAAVAAAPVAQDTCESRDSDGDGVNDCLDKCPGTMKGAKVDSDGCLIRIELHGVNFKYDSAELTDSAKRILDETAENLILFPEKRDIEVAGHTSTEGTNEYNMRLSIRRAHSVADYLKAKGVTNQLYPKGYGEEYPLVPEHSEADREKNRRVELIWMGD
ncbi:MULTISPECIES: OmpA family protein [Methylococcus]|jgi:OOP family OmpA-OmpF porin|uniref:Outer membrane protein MopB n=3 Tax=Methylococcus capsulatus TaxID=414 RepID=G1UBD8_METCA|nr:OmpA family protein [Methylococcus capsulatus]AAD01925.1 MopB [Methylococcus capsulatus str. Bath]AAU90789.1 outer membrane protein MopB [Methylococcus capsulatus str. Bath]QXP86500.1 OmpA family protein [Methylococcus capsulatus]QXP89282.1 OmpA family protein [Methylococcus capsulatus]QXP93832.1 OmpA family protein [Methylococcus capsulatus]